jgi:hypothetical protein
VAIRHFVNEQRLAAIIFPNWPDVAGNTEVNLPLQYPRRRRQLAQSPL